MKTGFESQSARVPILTLMALLLVAGSSANFNLYLSKAEVKRLLGLNAELFYIREGVVNDYAMKFTVKIPPEIHSIFFRWEAMSKRPVLYNMAVRLNETTIKGGKALINDPYFNISMSGTIPKKTEAFQLTLPCTGLISGEVEVILNLNVTSPSPNQPPTVLYFNRKKICLKGVAAEQLLPRKSLQNPAEKMEKEDAELEEEGLPLFVYILSGIAAIGAVIAVVGAIACWKAYKKMRKYPFPAIHQPVFVRTTDKTERKCSSLPKSTHSQMNNVYTSPSGLYTGPSGTYTLPSALTANSYASVYKFPFHSVNITSSVPPCKCTDSSCSGIYESSCYSNGNSRSESYFSRDSREDKCPLKCKYDNGTSTSSGGVPPISVSDLKGKFRQLQMDRERVRLTEVVQEGRTGRIYKGWLQREHPELDQQVVIKTFREGSNPAELETLCREGTLLAGVRHQNLLSLVGVSTARESPPFLIFPDVQGKNFSLYLRSCPVALKIVDLVELCWQASKGVSFMHNNHLLHRDIAARNCIISERVQLRLTDSALSRDFFPEDYESATAGTEEGHLLAPVRWMAPEVLREGQAETTDSDVWSLGVLMWEASTRGKRPYTGIPSSEVFSHLAEGARLPQPPTCPEDLYHLMTSCWGVKGHLRPSTQQVVEFLTSFRQRLTAFI